eukprot:c32839_g1_i1 orf=36-347(+)
MCVLASQIGTIPSQNFKEYGYLISPVSCFLVGDRTVIAFPFLVGSFPHRFVLIFKFIDQRHENQLLKWTYLERREWISGFTDHDCRGDLLRLTCCRGLTHFDV